jgi:mono/diheme cytochrome c family protein
MARRGCLGLCVAAILESLAVDAPACADQPAAGQAQRDAASGPAILNGYRRYNSACNHCHGPDGVGSAFAPSLIEHPLPYPRFREIVEQGSASGVSVMRGFADDPNIAPYIRDMYLYLAARADGSIGRGRPAR